MHRLVFLAAVASCVAAAAAPAIAKPDLPVGVTGNGNGGICVTVSYQVPQCVDFGKPAAPAR